jgi:hypothetical protein
MRFPAIVEYRDRHARSPHQALLSLLPALGFQHALVQLLQSLEFIDPLVLGQARERPHAK